MRSAVRVTEPVVSETGRFLAGADQRQQSGPLPAKGHWLDKLMALMENHRLDYLTQLETLGAEAQPLLALFLAGRATMTPGSQP